MIYWQAESNGNLEILHDAMILWRTELNGDLGILHATMILWQTELLGDSERYAIYNLASRHKRQLGMKCHLQFGKPVSTIIRDML